MASAESHRKAQARGREERQSQCDFSCCHRVPARNRILRSAVCTAIIDAAAGRNQSPCGWIGGARLLGFRLRRRQIARRAGRLPTLASMLPVAKRLVGRETATAKRDHAAAGEAVFFSRGIADRHFAFQAQRAMVGHSDFCHPGTLAPLTCRARNCLAFLREMRAGSLHSLIFDPVAAPRQWLGFKSPYISVSENTPSKRKFCARCASRAKPSASSRALDAEFAGSTQASMRWKCRRWNP